MPIEQTIKPDWETVQIPTFSSGLDNYLSPENIDKTALVVAENVNVVKDLLVGDLGYYFYKYKSTTLSGAHSAGATTITFPSAVAYNTVVGNKVAIYLDNGEVFVTPVVTIASTSSITILATGLPSAASNGNVVNLERYVLGTPMKFHKLETPTGASSYFMFTTKTVLRDTTADYWTPVATGATLVTTTLHLGQAAGTVNIVVVDTTGFSAGDLIRVKCTDGHYYSGIITSVAAGAPGSLLCTGYPMDEIAPIGAEVTKCVLLSGTTNNKISVVTIPWEDKMMYTNGIDSIRVYTESTGLSSTGGPASTLCKSLAIYDSSVILVSTIESGTNYKQRLRWCDKADITNWTTGDSGYVDLYDTAKECLAAKVLGPYLYVYRRKGIYRGNVSQRGDRRFDWDEIITNHGILSSDCVQEIAENIHMIFDDENVYLYDGSFSAEPIGNNIRDQVFLLSGNIDPTQYQKTSVLYVPELKSAFIAYAETGLTDPKTTYRFAINEKAWTKRSFSVPVWALGKGNATSTITWNTVNGTWDGVSYSWDSAYLSAVSDTILLALGNAPNGGAYVYQKTRIDDAGTPINYKVQTKNFVEVTEVRLDWIDVWAAGEEISVSYSIDRGITWQAYGTISGTSDILKYRLHKQFTSSQYMFMFEAANTTFSLLRLQIRITPETERI